MELTHVLWMTNFPIKIQNELTVTFEIFSKQENCVPYQFKPQIVSIFISMKRKAVQACKR